MGRRNRELGRHVVWGSGDTTVWRYDSQKVARELAKAAVKLLPTGMRGRAKLERVVRRKKGGDSKSYIPGVKVDGHIYRVVLARDGTTAVMLRLPRSRKDCKPITLLAEATA